MSGLQALLEEKARVEAEIAAQKPAAIAQVFALMQQLGVTPADLGLQPIKVARAPLPGKAPVRYQDGEGRTWTGVGKRPNWLRDALAAGADIKQFRVKG
jgi:DNA-binding protein H-NS